SLPIALRVAQLWPRVRYPRPTVASVASGAVTAAWPAKKSRAASTSRASTSARLGPSQRGASTPGEHVGAAPPAPAGSQRLGSVAGAVALRAGRVDVGQKMHLHRDVAE